MAVLSVAPVSNLLSGHQVMYTSFDPRLLSLDLAGMKRSLGLDEETASLTQRELVERRALIQERLEGANGS